MWHFSMAPPWQNAPPKMINVKNVSDKRNMALCVSEIVPNLTLFPVEWESLVKN
jgi:hypothetical protein